MDAKTFFSTPVDVLFPKGTHNSCKKCGTRTDGINDERGITYFLCKHGILCADCYYESMGREVEKHPIMNPVMILRMRARHGRVAHRGKRARRIAV